MVSPPLMAKGQYFFACFCGRCIARGLLSLPRFLIFIRRCFTISNKEQLVQINEEITDAEIRVIGADGAQLGIMTAEAALEIAAEADLDLVKIAPQAVPPVCKIMDYGKYRFEQQKKAKEAKKNQHTVEIKEIHLSLNIDTHDFDTKAGHAARFIQGGDRVKVLIRFRGREMARPENGKVIMDRFAEKLSDIAVVEKPAKQEGRNMIMFLSAKPAAKSNKQSSQAKEKPAQ